MIRKAVALTFLAILTGCATIDRPGLPGCARPSQPFKGMTKDEFSKFLYCATYPISSSREPFYDSENQIEIISAGKSARYIHYVFVDVSIPNSLASWWFDGNGTLYSFHTTMSGARADVASLIRSRMAENTSYGAVPETNSKQTSKQGNAKPMTPGKRRVAPIID